MLGTAWLRKPYAAKLLAHTPEKEKKNNKGKKCTRSPVKANGQNSRCIISKTSDVEER